VHITALVTFPGGACTRDMTRLPCTVQPLPCSPVREARVDELEETCSVLQARVWRLRPASRGHAATQHEHLDGLPCPELLGYSPQAVATAVVGASALHLILGQQGGPGHLQRQFLLAQERGKAIMQVGSGVKGRCNASRLIVKWIQAFSTAAWQLMGSRNPSTCIPWRVHGATPALLHASFYLVYNDCRVATGRETFWRRTQLLGDANHNTTRKQYCSIYSKCRAC
jgi:hypothetical protein